MSDYCVQTKHVSQKISKVRWRFSSDPNSVQPTIFLTGGCDKATGNILTLWLIPNISAEDTQTDDNNFSDEEPQSICSSSQSGDVTDLLFLNECHFLSASSNGDLNLFQYNEDFQVINLHHKWKKLHHHPNLTSAPCMGVTALSGGEVVATVGKEGKINILQHALIRPDAPVANIKERACHTTPTAIKFLQRSTVGVTNFAGQLLLWDVLREGKSSKPSKIFQLTDNSVPFLCMDQHPSQSHIIAVGGQDGRVYVWDLRQETKPVAIHNGHSYDVMELKFHPDLPNNIFTCSEDGSLWHWGSDESSFPALINQSRNLYNGLVSETTSLSGNWLLNSETPQGRVVINDMLPGNKFPVNSLDVSGSRLVSGREGEQIFVFSNISIC